MQQRLTIITLGVRDVTKATAFYENVFGWTKLPSSNEHISFFQLNGIQFALFNRDELAKDANVSNTGSGFSGVTLAHNMRSETEVDELIANLEQQGVQVVKRPEKVFWGGYSSYISDPDGHLWEIAYNPFLPLDENGNTLATDPAA